MKRGFALITAIIFVILISTLGTLSIYLSSASVKQTGDVYLREQAEILARSATEFTLLAMQGHSYKGKMDEATKIVSSEPCLKKIEFYFPNDGDNYLFKGTSLIRYIASDMLNCDVLAYNQTGLSADANLTSIIDVTVESNPKISTELIRYHRRTTQKH